ncbi:VTC domain-containing protein [Acanthopleuribacter pedis]|uniref:VTC domain-containing protein n=1 Tax=Acanthopleuribacter pedis TaxID=442870 RepID=A0A8J7U1Q1_9BACT|nr:VTC domain-containing protein [Acanthopleuribacter pedis]MBO1317762.1 VTC domain-containing protein [Acanthopleuribacter pedis]
MLLWNTAGATADEKAPEEANRSDDGRFRHEFKLVSQEFAYAGVMGILRAEAALAELHPARRVQSVYLDTPNGRALEENLAGISHREKVRFRWYGSETTGVPGRLECKVRHNLYGWKHLVQVEQPLAVEGCNRFQFVRQLEALVEADWRDRLRGLQPAQWIRYEREYLGSIDERLRVTVDRKLVVSDQRLRARLCPRFATPTGRLLIVEIKCSAENYRAAQRLVNRLPMQVGKCSKFVLASSPAEGPMPALLWT